MISGERHFTAGELAERWRCTRWHIYDLVEAGKLAVLRMHSRRLLFTKEAVEAAERAFTQPAA
jgi:excisionase family DNA binding protein